MYNVEFFFEKHHVTPEKIKYITRENKRTILYLTDQQTVSTLIPQKELFSSLPEGEFLNISKGIIIRKDQIVQIEDDGTYLVRDGRSFQGRRRNLHEHKEIRRQMKLSSSVSSDVSSEVILPDITLSEQCQLLDSMPFAFCVIELVFDHNGHGVDFVFRYCNSVMAKTEGIPKSEIINHSFYEVFEEADRKWLVTYADVALNRTTRTLEDFNPKFGKPVKVCCYSPQENYCACIRIPC